MAKKELNEALFEAIDEGNVEEVKSLINAGADVNARNDDEWTPLILCESADIAKILIDAGADVNATNNDGDTALHFLSDADIWKLLIEAKADVNATNNDGETPLHRCDRVDATKLLIDAGANVNAKDHDGKTPLHWRAKSSLMLNPDLNIIIKLLIDAGADVNAKDNKGKTPLQIYDYDDDVAKLLTSAIAKTKVKNKENTNAKDTEKHASFANMTFLFTGKLEHMKREEAEAKVEALGGKAVSGVSKTLSVLVATSDTSAKWTKAQELNSKGANIQLWTEEQFMAELEKAEASGDGKAEEKSQQQTGAVATKATKPASKPKLTAKQLEKLNKSLLKLFDGKISSMEEIKSLIDAGADVNTRDKKGETPLHKYCDNYEYIHLPLPAISSDVAKMLIEAGADVNARDNEGKAPLHYLSASYQEKDLFYAVVKMFIDAGADANAKDNYGITPLYQYANCRDDMKDDTRSKYKYIDVIKLLIDAGADVNAKITIGGYGAIGGATPLHECRDANITKLLIAAGANVNAKNDYGNTPLHSCDSFDIAKVLKILIDAGADVNARDNEGNTRLHYSGKLSKDVAKVLIKSGADVNAKNKHDETPLSKQANIDIIKLLIDAGANVNARDYRGKTQLHKWSQTDALRFFIDAGVDVNARDNEGKTPLHSYYTNLEADAIKLLIDAGADVNTKDNDGESPLHSYCRYPRSADCVKLLIDAGADVNAKDKDGKTPLHKTIDVSCFDKKNAVEIAKVLIEEGADVNAKDNDGKTVLQYCNEKVDEGSKNCVYLAKLLIKSGATVNTNENNSFEDADSESSNKATLYINAHGNVCSYSIVQFNPKDEDNEINLKEVREAFKDGDGGTLYDLIENNSDESIDMYCLWKDDDEAFAWTLEAEDGSEISSGTRRCYLEDILDEDDMEEDVYYTDNDYVLMFYEYVKGTQASFEVPADINMEEIKFIPHKLMPGKFKKDKMYYKAFGKKNSSLNCFQYKDKCYSSDDYDNCDSYGIEAYILIKYDAKERSWKVVNYMQA